MKVITQQNKQKIEQTKKRNQNLTQIELEILSYSGLKINEQILSLDITLKDGSWMHEVSCGFQNKKHLVLLHGYGGCALTFIRLFADLSKQYHVHALDHMGMGLSGRRTFSDDLNQQQMVDYFIDAIEEWRVQSKIDTFTMSGHSFGGYMAAAYSVKYPKQVNRLILISPVGTKFSDKDSNEKEYEQIRQKGSFQRKMFLSLAKTLIGWQITPSRVLNWAIFGNMFLNRIVESRLKLQNKQKQLWKQFFQGVSKITPNSEVSFWRLFYMPGAGTSNPTSKLFCQIKLPFQIQYYYGDNDWMQKQTAYDLVKNSNHPNKISYTVVENAGHQIVFDNPNLMSEYILNH